MKFKSMVSERVFTEKEFKAYRIKEYANMWESGINDTAEEFKEEGKEKNDFIDYMLEYDTGVFEDFEVIEE